MGRERELRERDGSHKRSRNHSRKLRERTPLLPGSESSFTEITAYVYFSRIYSHGESEYKIE